MPVVSALRIAPVKGLASVPVPAVQLGLDGVAQDRRVFLLDGRGAVVTLRSHPQLAQVVPRLDLDAGVLRISLPDGAAASTDLEQAAEHVTAHLYGKDRAGRVLHGNVADALSSVAGEPVRVVLADAVGTGWDEGPVSLLGTASAAAVGAPDSARFRMLVEVDGLPAYEEDTWVGADVEIGGARVHVTHPLVRCVIITQSPTTGMKDWDGLKTLARVRGPELCLGVIAEVRSPGEIRLGDEVRVATPSSEQGAEALAVDLEHGGQR